MSEEIDKVEALIAATVSAVTSVAVALISFQLASRQQSRSAERTERKILSETYLNPLRFQIADNHYRILDALRRPAARQRMLAVNEAKEISSKGLVWFNEEGSYLASSVYLMACLFAYLKRVRDQVPYLQLPGNDDTRLVELMLKLQIPLVKEGGVQYAVQTSLGQDMWVTENRLCTYREFCELLREPESRVWFDRLITFFVEIGRRQKIDRALKLVTAMWELAAFLDECVGGGRAIISRWEADEASLQLMKIHGADGTARYDEVFEIEGDGSEELLTELTDVCFCCRWRFCPSLNRAVA